MPNDTQKDTPFIPSPYVIRSYAKDMETNTRLIDGDISPYLRKVADWVELQKQPVSLMDCAMALQRNQRIKLGSDLQVIAKAVLEAAGIPYVA